MRKKKKPDDEIFEITDFTNATPFEDFVASIEQIVDVWALTHGKSWQEDSIPAFTRSESLTYNKQSYRLTHHTIQYTRLDQPLQQATFPSRTHCLHRWFGLSEFLILSPETTEDAVFFLDTSKLLLSGLACALTRTKCTVPTFIQLGSPSKRFYSGIWLNNSLQSTMEMVLLKSPPPQCSSLKEILCFYKRSVPCSISPFPCIYISVRYTFSLFNFIGSQSLDHVYDNEDKSVIRLPLGTARDPIQDLLLATTWQALSEHLVSDTESGELDPFRAPFWSLRYTSTSNPFCLLSNYLDYVVTMVSSKVTLLQLLGTPEDNHELDVQNAFRSLNQPMLQIPKFDIAMLPGKLLGTYGALVKSVVIEELIEYVFSKPYSETEGGYSAQPRVETKTCPTDSLSYRISIALCCVLCYHGGLKGFAQLWKAIIERLRSHYEEGQLIPGVSTQPDPGLCLFHQKLQMVNACIVQKIERDSKKQDDDQSDNEQVHPSLTLLLTAAPLVIPVTQRHAPMTEDMQEAHAEALTKLGSSAEGSRLRAQLHSVSLLSDMQAFKAANPDCRLEDFIRWYSPRDWVSVPITKPIIPLLSNPVLDDALDGNDTSSDASNDADVTLEDEQSEGEFEDLENAPSSLNDEQKRQEEEEKLAESADVPKEGEKLGSEDEGVEKYEGVLDTADTEPMVTDPVVVDEIKAVVNEIIMETLSQVAESQQTEVTDPESEQAVDPDDVVLDEEKDNEDVHLDSEEELLKDGGEEIEDSTQYETMQTDAPDDEEDDFVDAEEDFMECESTTHLTAKSDDFQSGSETSFNEPIAISINNLKPGELGNSPEDEFALSHISDSDSGSPSIHSVLSVTPEPEVEQGPLEEPLDPESVGGHLSSRMAKDSTWSETWHTAKPVPIWHQKRLFDDTKEAEKVLHYFSHSEISAISLLILPPLLHAALDRLKASAEAEHVTAELAVVHDMLKNLHRYSNTDTDYLQDIIAEVQKSELLISKYKSLTAKLMSGLRPSEQAAPRKITQLEKKTRRLARPPKLAESPSVTTVETVDETQLITSLITSEIELPGGVKSCWGPTLQRLFHAQQIASLPIQHGQSPPPPQQIPIFPGPIGREYILQTVTAHPSSVSRPCPQRMFCCIAGNEFRMATATTTDKGFL